MKKIIWGILCLIVMVMSCEIPRSLTIKGGPTLSIPLGSPLSDENKIGDFLSPAKIKEMMGENSNINIIDYWYPQSDQEQPFHAYIVHYPIVEMKLDLSEYMSDMAANMDFTYSIPGSVSDIPANNFPAGGFYLTKDGPGNSHGVPLFTVDLSDMFKLVTGVEGRDKAFGIEINYKKEFEDNLKVYIPAFGVGSSVNYQAGSKVGNKLKFVNAGNHTFSPQYDLENGELKIYIQVTGPCSGIIEPSIVFDWDTATIKPDDKLNDTFDIDFDLSASLGDGVSFKRVEGFIYVGGVGENAILSLMSIYGELVDEDKKLENKPKPSFLSSAQSFNQALPEDSLKQKYLDFTDIVNTSGKTSINYDLRIDERTIENDNLTDIIFADLIIVLYMEFNVTGASSESGYVQLDLGFGDLFSGIGEGDWFGRTHDGEDSLLSNVDTVKIILKNLQNDIFYDDGFSILFVNFGESGKPNFSRMINFRDKPEPSMTMIMDELPIPFNPRIELLLLADPGTLKIKRQDLNRNPDPKFDFLLTIEADINFNQTITF